MGEAEAIRAMLWGGTVPVRTSWLLYGGCHNGNGWAGSVPRAGGAAT